MSNIKKFAGQTAIYGISTIFSRVLNFFLTPLYTRVYSQSVYGIFGYMYSWAAITNAVLSFGMETTFFRYLNKEENSRDKVYSNTFIVIASICAVFLAFTSLFVNDIARLMHKGVADSNYVSFVKYFIYILVADAMAVIPFAKLRAEGKAYRYAIIKFVNIFMFIGLNLVFILLIPFVIKHELAGSTFFQSWYKGTWIGYVFIANLVASLFTLILLIPEILQLKLKFDRLQIIGMLSYSLPILVANLSFIVNENIDKIFLQWLLPPAIGYSELGIYNACCKLAIFLSIFVQAFRLGAEPFFFNHAKNKNAPETYSKIMTYFVITISLIFVGIIANIEILKGFIDAKFWSGLGVVPVLLFGYVSLGIYMNLSIWYKLSDQTRYGLYISGIGAMITIVLNIIFIPKYSYMASAWVSLIAYSSMMVLSYVLGQKNYPIPYNLKKNLMYLVSSVTIVTVSFKVFDRSLVIGNIFLVLFVIIALYAERKELMLLLKKNDHSDNKQIG